MTIDTKKFFGDPVMEEKNIDNIISDLGFFITANLI